MESDSLAAEQIETTLRTPGWVLIAKRIEEERERRVRELINGGGSADKTRGMIQALETVLRIPGIIAGEARGKRG